MFLKNKNIIFKIRRSKVTDYAALNQHKKIFRAQVCGYFVIYQFKCVCFGCGDDLFKQHPQHKIWLRNKKKSINDVLLIWILVHGTKIFKYCTCSAVRVHSSCKHKHLSFKSVCNKERKGVIWNFCPLLYISSEDFGTYCIYEQQKVRQGCTSAQSLQSLFS